jgi:hypothetical protein
MAGGGFLCLRQLLQIELMSGRQIM